VRGVLDFVAAFALAVLLLLAIAAGYVLFISVTERLTPNTIGGAGAESLLNDPTMDPSMVADRLLCENATGIGPHAPGGGVSGLFPREFEPFLRKPADVVAAQMRGAGHTVVIAVAGPGPKDSVCTDEAPHDPVIGLSYNRGGAVILAVDR
jgi:hypothetical protein